MTIPKHKKFRPSEKFLINQFTDHHTIRGVQWVKKIIHGVPALRNRDCRRFFFGQLVSNVGSWMQLVALSWLVYDLTKSAFWVGAVAASSSVPALAFSLFGGTIVDRFSKKQILLVTHITATIVALMLGILSQTNNLNLNAIIIFSFISGIINSIYTPAHYAFLPELVDKNSLSSAISINAAVSSLGRVLGPALAGIYIKYAGVSGTFVINAVSYLAVIIALMLIKNKGKIINQKLKPIEAIKAGIVYSYYNPFARSILLYATSASIFMLSFTTIIPVIAEKIFNTGSIGMGNMHMSMGIGAIIATIFSAYFSHKLSKLSLFLAGNLLFSLSLLTLSITTIFPFGLFLTFLAGLGLTLITIVLSVLIQNVTAPEYRGRVLSINFMTIGGIAFLGNLEIGFLTESFGPQIAIRINTLIMLAIAIYILLIKDAIRQKQKVYNQLNQK